MAKKFTKLTRSSIRKLKSGQSIAEQGIIFTRAKNGDGVYSVNIMVDGERIHRVVGRESDGTTRTQAEDFISQARSDAKHARLTLPKGRKVALSFRKAATKYLAKLEEEGGKDIEKKRRRLEINLVPFFGERPLSKITTFDVDRYKKKRRAEPARKGKGKDGTATFKNTPTSAGTINRELAVLSHLFNKAVEWGWITHKPALIRRLKEESDRITYLTSDQANQILAAARGDTNPQIHPFILIGLETSMRMSEILSIRVEHIDIDKRLIHIPKAKAGARQQPITRNLADFLCSYMASIEDGTNNWLFPSPSNPGAHTTNIRSPFRRVVVAAGLDPTQVVRHTLRHTAITHLVQAGVDLPTVQRISGHKTLAMVTRYAHANGAHIEEAMDKLESRYAIAENLPRAEKMLP